MSSDNYFESTVRTSGSHACIDPPQHAHYYREYDSNQMVVIVKVKNGTDGYTPLCSVAHQWHLRIR